VNAAFLGTFSHFAKLLFRIPRKMRTSDPPMASRHRSNRRKKKMAESVYKIIELVGTSDESWEKAAMAAVKTASKSLRDLRIAEVVQLDLQIEDGKVRAYRAKVKVSFKFKQD
jgi:flavin-binding protein dodecin